MKLGTRQLHPLGLVGAVRLQEVDQLAARGLAFGDRPPRRDIRPVVEMRGAFRQDRAGNRG